MNINKVATWFIFMGIFLGLGGIYPVSAVDPVVMLDELMAYPNAGGEEWIELLNPSQTSALDLTGWRLVINQGSEGNYTYHYEQNLSGSVPREGFLTFTVGNGTTIPDDGACLIIFRNGNESVYAVKYGNGSCDAGAGEQDASAVAVEQGKSIYYNLDQQTWNSTNSPTRGWCNPGSGACPTISTITTQMNGENVATNLGDQTDFSRISGLYFRKSESGQNIGQITFLAEMNFTDRDALSWMQSLDSKLSISQGVIGLDADLIKNLTNTRASLTMYNITLNDPKILVDGQDDNSGVTSGLTYDRTAHTLTFTAAHFTTFTAVENTSSSNSSSSPALAPACGDWPPLTVPNLFQIDTTNTTATLYFSPVNDYLSYYFIAYGFKEGDWRFGTQFNSSQKIGVVSHKINALSPNTKYYFQVRGGNGCAPGKWSKSLMAKTDPVVRVTEEVETPAASKAMDIDELEETGIYKNPDPTLAPQPTSTTTVIEPIETEKIALWQKIANFFGRLFE